MNVSMLNFPVHEYGLSVFVLPRLWEILLCSLQSPLCSPFLLGAFCTLESLSLPCCLASSPQKAIALLTIYEELVPQKEFQLSCHYPSFCESTPV